jgi:hypothetical protein
MRNSITQLRKRGNPSWGKADAARPDGSGAIPDGKPPHLVGFPRGGTQEAFENIPI